MDNLLRSLIGELETGKNSAHLIRNILQSSQQEFNYKGFDVHSKVVFNSFNNALSLLQGCDAVDDLLTRVRKVASDDLSYDDHLHHVKSEQESPRCVNTKDRRGCYKRRKTGQTMSMKETSTLTDDGFAWRKYGQKNILNNKHPKSYYRCTHKHDQRCLAMKQVQKVSENPTLYRIIYLGDHTCNNHIKDPSSIYPDYQHDHDSSIFLNFENPNIPPPIHTVNPHSFTSPSPSSWISPSPSPSPSPSTSTSSSSPFFSAMVKKELYVPIKDQIIPSGPSDHDHNYVSSSSTSDQGDVISSSSADDHHHNHQIYDSSMSFSGINSMDDDYILYSCFMADPLMGSSLDAVMYS